MARKSNPMNRDEVVAVERFRVDVQDRILRLMRDKGVSQKELAELLGLSQPRISQIFSPKCNLTIRLMARVFHALDDQVWISSYRLEELVAPRPHRPVDRNGARSPSSTAPRAATSRPKKPPSPSSASSKL